MSPESQLKPYLSMVDEQAEETKSSNEVFDFLFEKPGQASQPKKHSPYEPSSKVLMEIDKDSTCRIVTRSIAENERLSQGYKIFGILGIVNIEGLNFLGVIAERQNAGKLTQGCNIFEVMATKLLPLFILREQLPQSVVQYKEGVEKLLSNSGFYYSYYTDLTVNMQHDGRRHKQTDTKYFWNFNILKDFRFQNVSEKWTVPVIQGYVETTTQRFMQKELNMTLISRRSFAMAGTRFNARGLDEHGNVANYVETELVINFDNGRYLFSHIQVRGSVPVFWS